MQTIEKAVSFEKLTCQWTILGAAADVRRSDGGKTSLPP
jgi:hypothetical protein